MQETDDIELLRDYAARDSERAFDLLVNRHVDLVYSVALRRVSDPAMAAEVTQTVFIILARKARELRPGIVLPGWLYRTTQLVANRAIRTECRRREREKEAAQMQREETDLSGLQWDQIAPLLEEAMANLREADRNAVVLRYFQNKKLKEVGAALGSNEDAVQKRLSRALEKLRRFFEKRGVALPASVLIAMVSAHAVQSAPLGMASATVAAAQGITATASTLTLAKATLEFMAWTKVKTAMVTTLAVLLTGGIATVVIKGRIGQKSQPVDRSASDGVPPEQRQTQKMSCLDNLKQIGAALRGWASDHNQVFPGKTDSLENYLSSPARLICPSDHTKTAATTWEQLSPAKISYVFVSPGAKADRPNLIVAKCPLHGTVLLAEGRVFAADYIQQEKMRVMPDNTLQ